MANLDAFEAELLKPSVLKEGHLLKLGRNVLKCPKLKYYILKPSGVYCFKGKHECDVVRSFIPLEEISLSLGTVVEAHTELHCIKIADRHKLHVLACHSLEIRDSWITAILTAVAQRLVDEPHLLRKRVGSASSSPDPEVFCEMQCQFTSPFWASQENNNKRKSRAGRLSIQEVVFQKTRLTARTTKNSLLKSLSLEDIPSILKSGQQKAKLTRKRSIHDLSRYFFGLNSSKPSDEEECKIQTNDVPNKENGKRRWSLFGMASSLGMASCESPDRVRKNEAFYEQGNSLIWDTKL